MARCSRQLLGRQLWPQALQVGKQGTVLQMGHVALMKQARACLAVAAVETWLESYHVRLC